MTNMLSEEDKALEDVVLTRLMRMNAVINGIVFGIVLGGLIFIATIWLVLKGGDVVGPNLALLNQFFIGYSVTFVGSLVGFVYGFITGFLVGAGIALIYNFVVDLRNGRSKV